MTERIDMALDDIIKASKKGGSGGGAGKKFDTRKSSRGRGGGGRSKNGRTGGGITKLKYFKGDVNGTWKHDLFNDFGQRNFQKTDGFTRGPTKLIISNLDIGVSDSDMHELFSEFGILKGAAVHYDRSGRSLGTADVLFETRGAALKAMKHYNGLRLDGRPMNILLASSDINPLIRDNRNNRLGGRAAQDFNNTNRGGVGGGGKKNQGRGIRGGHSRRGPGGQPRGARSTPTAEQLDAELDNYNSERK